MESAILCVPVEQIEENPDQPRTSFNNTSLKELADSIKLRGVKTPISVHPQDDNEKPYMINHGARRYRAAIMAGLKTIPCFIDSDYSEADQIIENLHRDNLTPREIAEFINRQLEVGKKKSQLAKEIGKSNAFITQHYVLLNLPDCLDALFNSGRCSDVTAIYEFSKFYKSQSEILEEWLTAFGGRLRVDRHALVEYKEYLQTTNFKQRRLL